MTDDDITDNFRYINCEEIECYNELNNLLLDRQNSSYKVLHLNIRSYYKNIDPFLVMLTATNICFDFIILSEAWLDVEKNITRLHDYDTFFTTDCWNRNDGVIVFAKTCLNVTSQQIRIGQATGLQLSFDTNKRQHYLLAIYRSPSMDFNLFISDLSDYCFSTVKGNTYLVIGDMNIDINTTTDNAEKDTYLNVMHSAGFISCIDKPTRVTEHSQTCLDHIFIKHSNHHDITAAVFKTDITDHYAVTAKINCSYIGNDLGINGRLAHYVDLATLDGLIRSQSWDEVLAQRDVNTSCRVFENIIETLRKASMKQKTITSRLKKIKPWITVGLVRAIRKRDKLSKMLKRQPFNDQLKNYYKNFRNNLQKSIKRTKFEYYKNKILNSENNPKAFWSTINEFSGMGKSKNSFPIKHFVKGSDSAGGALRDVASSFNKFFSEVGYNLARELPHAGAPLVVDDAEYRVEHALRLEPVNEDQVRRCVREMRGGSAPGIDNLSPTTLKNNIDYLIKPLTHILNLSITQGIFPDTYKIAKVIPIYKSKEKSNLNNYRPISLLSVLSKVLEKCVKWQLQYYLESNLLLADCQFGFRRRKNTSDALFTVNKCLMDLINRNKKCLVIFIDLAKAFDSIDRSLLFDKLDCIGIKDGALNWFKSYLSDRKQVVSIFNQTSNELNVDYGVVQGSTLGPLLFLIYINNLGKMQISGKFFLFADDTAVVFEGNTWQEVFQTANRELLTIKSWFDQNRLTMNVNKTKYLPISLRAGGEPPNDLRVALHVCGDYTTDTACDCQIIEQVDHYKYLGVVFDSRLRWDYHVNFLKNKMRRFIYPFYQLSHILNDSEFKIIYCAFVQSVLQYGIISWGGANKSIIEPLLIVQKALIKTGLKKQKRYPTDLLFTETSILNVTQLYIKNILMYIFLNKESVICQITHNYRTRNAENVNVKVPRAVKSINFTNSYFNANLIYRNIPVELRQMQCSFDIYKQRVTTWLLAAGTEHAEALLTSVYNS